MDTSLSKVLGVEQRVAGMASRSVPSSRNILPMAYGLYNALVATLKKGQRNR